MEIGFERVSPAAATVERPVEYVARAEHHFAWNADEADYLASEVVHARHGAPFGERGIDISAAPDP